MMTMRAAVFCVVMGSASGTRRRRAAAAPDNARIRPTGAHSRLFATARRPRDKLHGRIISGQWRVRGVHCCDACCHRDVHLCQRQRGGKCC